MFRSLKQKGIAPAVQDISISSDHQVSTYTIPKVLKSVSKNDSLQYQITLKEFYVYLKLTSLLYVNVIHTT